MWRFFSGAPVFEILMRSRHHGLPVFRVAQIGLLQSGRKKAAFFTHLCMGMASAVSREPGSSRKSLSDFQESLANVVPPWSPAAKRSTYGTKFHKDSVEFIQVGEVCSLSHNQINKTSRITDACKQKINAPKIDDVI